MHILDTGDVKLIGHQDYEEISRESETKTITCEPDSKLLMRIQAGANEDEKIVSALESVEQEGNNNQERGASSFMKKIVSAFRKGEKKDNNNQDSKALSPPVPDPAENIPSSNPSKNTPSSVAKLKRSGASSFMKKIVSAFKKVENKDSAKVFVALYDYDSGRDKDLSFKKRDRLVIIDDTHPDIWFARNIRTNQEGYIISNYVAKLNSIDAEPWYFGKIKRIEAEEKLLLEQNEHGAFLIRDSESRRNEFSLSVRNDTDTVKHYRIRKLDEGGFFITRGTTFQTLKELVEHYSVDLNLREACVHLERPVSEANSYIE